MNIPLISAKFINYSLFAFNLHLTIFGLNYNYLASPYIDHDASTHHALHVMDVP